MCASTGNLSCQSGAPDHLLTRWHRKTVMTIDNAVYVKGHCTADPRNLQETYEVLRDGPRRARLDPGGGHRVRVA